VAGTGATLNPRWLPRGAAAEALTIWAISFAAIVITFVTLPWAAKLVATASFLYLPLWSMDRRAEAYGDLGLSTRRLWADVRDFLSVAAIVFPVFVLGYVAFVRALPLLPREWIRVMTPYLADPKFVFALPDRFAERVIDQVLVVALPEELFYRGFIQTRLRDAWPQGRLLWGARLGPAFWLTALLFALGHLAIFQVWRLAVFFPALLFGWMRERSGSVIGAALVHASANLLVQTLDASFFR
jgi:uncharacterized protein